MSIDNLINNLNLIQDNCETINNALDVASKIQPAVEVASKSSLPKNLNDSLELPTAEKLRQAIFALLTGQASKINENDAKPVRTGSCNDSFQNENVYDKTFSVGKHLTNKEKISEFQTQGIEIKLKQQKDQITDLPKYNATITEQQDIKTIYGIDGEENKSTPIETKNSQKVVPTNYTEDKYLQSIVNSMIVSISNSIAEAVTKTIVSKIESNQTEIEIEWDPTMMHTIKLANLTGPVVPGQMGSIISNRGVIAFAGGNKYKHKCRISFGKAKL